MQVAGFISAVGGVQNRLVSQHAETRGLNAATHRLPSQGTAQCSIHSKIRTSMAADRDFPVATVAGLRQAPLSILPRELVEEQVYHDYRDAVLPSMLTSAGGISSVHPLHCSQEWVSLAQPGSTALGFGSRYDLHDPRVRNEAYMLLCNADSDYIPSELSRYAALSRVADMTIPIVNKEGYLANVQCCMDVQVMPCMEYFDSTLPRSGKQPLPSAPPRARTSYTHVPIIHVESGLDVVARPTTEATMAFVDCTSSVRVQNQIAELMLGDTKTVALKFSQHFRQHLGCPSRLQRLPMSLKNSALRPMQVLGSSVSWRQEWFSILDVSHSSRMNSFVEPCPAWT
nr:hypothetical protein CFP56_71926 [Quercus suber]